MLPFSKIFEPNFSLFSILENKIIYFTGNEYQGIFIPFFLKRVQSIKNITINYIDIDNTDINIVKSKLEMSFLGQKSYFWLGNLSDISEKKRKELNNYLNSYAGNNIIFAFTNSDLIDEKKNNFVIDCDFVFNFEQLKNLVIFFDPNISKNTLYSLEKLFKNLKKINLDQAYILNRYTILLGTKTEEFTNKWRDKVLTFDESIFNLSKHFFSKDTKSFYNSFDTMSKEYQSIFWISFWSEQLFRSWAYLNFKMAKNEVEAKKIAYKLPFSFINYDWKKTSISELANAHNFIYNIDYNMKNGSSEASLDLFYCKFLSGCFKSTSN